MPRPREDNIDGAIHFIGGAFDPGLGTRTGPVYNPATGEVAYQLHYADRATLDRVCDIARTSGRDWGNSSHARRTAVMFRMRELVIRDTEILAELIGKENGKTLDDARGEIGRGDLPPRTWAIQKESLFL